MAATFKPGKISNTPTIAFSPSGAVAACDVEVVGNRPLMAPLAVAAGERGAFLPDSGTYIVTVDQAVVVPTDGVEVYWWNGTLDADVSEDGTHYHYGFIVPGTIVDNGSSSYTFEVYHCPNGTAVVVTP